MERLGDQILVVREVGQDVGSEIVSNDRDVVVLAERAEEVIGGCPHVVNEVVAVSGELKQHDCGYGGLGQADTGNGLRDAVFKDEEVIGFQSGDELVGFVEDNIGVDVDDGDVDAEGVGVAVGVFNLGLSWSGGRRGLLSLLLFLEDNGAIVHLGSLVVGGRLGRRLLLLGGRWGGLRLGVGQRKQ